MPPDNRWPTRLGVLVKPGCESLDADLYALDGSGDLKGVCQVVCFLKALQERLDVKFLHRNFSKGWGLRGQRPDPPKQSALNGACFSLQKYPVSPSIKSEGLRLAI